jgi:hypothetical protein
MTGFFQESPFMLKTEKSHSSHSSIRPFTGASNTWSPLLLLLLLLLLLGMGIILKPGAWPASPPTV